MSHLRPGVTSTARAATALLGALVLTLVPWTAWSEVGLRASSAVVPAATPLRATECATPALSPPLSVRTIDAGNGRERTAALVAAQGEELGVPARAQALAATAALAGDLADGTRTDRFYRLLDAVKGWEALPPTIAVHRTLGNADPFLYEPHWTKAVALLTEIVRDAPQSVDVAVSPAGKLPGTCLPTALDRRTLPLPPGSAYTVEGDTDESSQDTHFTAPCGTPVLAATTGTVEVVHEPTAGGPWTVSVQGTEGGVSTTYFHTQNLSVEDGGTVVVGQQIAEVGDLGDVDECTLGVRVEDTDGAVMSAQALVGWLSSSPEVTIPDDLPIIPLPNDPQTVPATPFRVASFNVLGAHLTGPGSDRPSYAPGPQRMAWAIAKLEAASVSVVVLNEFESPQAGVLAADPDWRLHRATPNNVFRDGNANGNAIAWQDEIWKLVEATEFTVPWQVTLHMPVVLLEHRETKGRVFVIGVHNPASTGRQGDQSGARAVARSIELDQVRALREGNPDVPVVLAGDFNERDEVFCFLTGSSVLEASAGGSVGTPCRPPAHGPVDWIFGTTDLDFRGQFIDRSTLGSVSDHPLLIADAVIPKSRR